MDRHLKEYFENYRKETDPIFERYFLEKIKQGKNIDGSVSVLIENYIDLAPRGKRVRGALSCIGYDLVGGEEREKMLRVSVGIELLNAGILIQDDFMDQDDMRRGVESVHARYGQDHLGNVMAVLAGDMGFGWALEIIYESGFEESRLLKAVKRYNELFYETVYGQTVDVYTAESGSVSAKQIEKIIKYKTSQYTFVLPINMGMILAGASEEQIKIMSMWARECGEVFQMRDDWLSAFGNSEVTGKPVGGDLREGKENIVAQTAREVMGDKFEQVRGKYVKDNTAKVISELKNAKVDEKVQKQIESKLEKVLLKIENMEGDKEARGMLSSLARYVARRDK